MRHMAERINPNFKSDYQEFLSGYILPLLGINVGKENKLLNGKELYVGPGKPTIEQIDGSLHFYISDWQIFSLPCRMPIPDDDIALVRRILQSFPNIAQYEKTGSGRFLPNKFPYEEQKDALYASTVQSGICRWLAGDQPGNRMDALFSELETWSVKTYEGKSVTMGFLINLEAKSNFRVDGKKWLDFMKDDAAAMLTDCIHSVIELDTQCDFVAYRSLSEGNRIPACRLSHKVPLRFSQMIQTQVVDKKLGVFLLSNGDIVLAKDQEIRFVRRNLRWLNFSYTAFRHAVDPFVADNVRKSERGQMQMEKLVESIFASVLDVSFSHAGAIISVVGLNWPERNPSDEDDALLADCDDLLCDAFDKAPYPDDIRPLKRVLLKKLIMEKRFYSMDRKLRGELLGMDGACILDRDGKVRSFGAIIRNRSGSLGGSRSAAARKLSEYGMAVKISTDGYIEVYISGELVYEVK